MPVERKMFNEGQYASNEENKEPKTLDATLTDDEQKLKKLIRMQKEIDREMKKKDREEKQQRLKEPRITCVSEIRKNDISAETLLGKFTQLFDIEIRRLINCRYRPSYEKMKNGTLIELKNNIDVPNGSFIDMIGLNVHCYSSEMRVTFLNIKGTSNILKEKGTTYIEIGTDIGSILSAAAVIALAENKIRKLYEMILITLTHMTKFNVGDVNLAGYDEYVEKGNQLVRYIDNRIANRHILLYGPPGTGKTQIAKKIVRDNPDLRCINIDVDTDLTILVPVLNEILKYVKSRMIIVIDEIDELGVSRNLNAEKTFALLRILDGVAEMKQIKFIATTNRLDVIDTALLRPGRLGPPIHIPPPTIQQRMSIIEHYNRKFEANLSEHEMKDILSAMYEGVTGSDIRAAFENCLIYGDPITVENITKNLMVIKKTDGPKDMYQ